MLCTQHSVSVFLRVVSTRATVSTSAETCCRVEPTPTRDFGCVSVYGMPLDLLKECKERARDNLQKAVREADAPLCVECFLGISTGVRFAKF